MKTDEMDHAQGEIVNLDGTPINEPPLWPNLRLPMLGRVFVVLTIADGLCWFARTLLLSGLSWFQTDASVLTFVALAVGQLCSVLAPTALIMRHPDARTTHPRLLAGLVAVAAVELGASISSTVALLRPSFLVPSQSDQFQSFVVGLGLQLVTLSGSTLGFVLVGLGLSCARRSMLSAGVDRRVMAALILGSLAVLVANLAALSYRPDLRPVDPSDVVLALGLVLNMLGWTYRARVVLAGALAGETPRTPWRIASLGIIASMGSLAIGALANVLPVMWGAGIDNAYLDSLRSAQTWLGFAASGLLLIALADGLPGARESGSEGEGAPTITTDPGSLTTQATR